MGVSKNKDHAKSAYIADMQEWQDHQYDPGYYTGGKMRPILKHPARPQILGTILLLIGAGVILASVWQGISYLNSDGNSADALAQLLLQCLPLFVFGGVMTIAGIAYLRVQTKSVKNPKSRRR